MATPVTIYGPPLSTAVSRVLATLIEKDVPFHLVPIDLSKGEQKKPEYLKIQPFGQVPAFKDESITLFESRAICRYICDKYADKGNRSLYGTDILSKANIDQWVETDGQTFGPPSGDLVHDLLFSSVPVDEALIKKNVDKLAKVLDIYEQKLGQTRFLAGDEFSFADLSHLPNGDYLVNSTDRYGYLFTSRKNVNRWWTEISNRESWKKVLEMRKNA